ncbi:histidine phosphatase family protein [Jatrophihabitans telluris]|uniref:Histidine phosphatase family protein n=1 Tax=Jatrophihabitans telluris TaxID=2038343 RepID=A0ABY4R0K5_9ACTN|nr:histidine phosphatase family protein [Jatrophihabitans telluris]UQX89426.1 histidine phosphatase family protein [Jatrophihabitans telluris]
MRLILIRHGQTESNLHHQLDTAEPGAPLTEVGHEQARALVQTLAGESIAVIAASVLIRTQQTAEPLAAARSLPVLVRNGVREIGAGELEMRGDPESGELYMKVAFGWADGDLDVSLPGGPDGATVLSDFDAAVAELSSMLASRQATAVIFSHGAILRTWLAARADNVDTEYAAAHPLSNTAIVTVEGTPRDGWHVLAWEGSPVLGPAADALADPTGQTHPDRP